MRITWTSLVRMTRTTLLLVALVAAPLGAAEAQFTEVPGTPYFMQRTPITYQPLDRQGSNACTQLGRPYFTESFNIDLPFTFRYYDTDETSVRVSNTGRLTFSTFNMLYYRDYPLGSSSSPNEMIQPFTERYMGAYSRRPNAWWCHQTLGEAPNRRWVIEWADHWYYFEPNGGFDMRIVLHEGPFRRIDIEYGSVRGTRSWRAVMGMEDASGGRVVRFAPSGCQTCSLTDLTSVANSRITFIQDAGVELVAQGITPPPFAFLGALTPIDVNVVSVHNNGIGPFSVVVEASLDQAFTNPVEIGRMDNVVLQGFESANLTIETTPARSLGEGQAYLRAVVDPNDGIAEAVETNNTVVGATTTRLLLGAPDLAVQRVTVQGTAFSSGDAVNIETTVRNVGGEPATDVPVRLVLSANPVISRQDVGLGSFNVTLAPGETVTTTTEVTIPAGTNSGSYYFGALADPDNAVDELNDTNNGLATFDTIPVTGASLAITTTRLPQGTLRVPYVALLEAVGAGDDAVWTKTEGELPQGLGLVPGTGEIFGRPIAVESQTFTVQVESNGNVATAELTLTVVDPEEPLTIVTRSLPQAVVGQEYTFELLATGGASASGDVTWSASDLPDGFMINDFGVLGGTATAPTTTEIEVSVTAGGETAVRRIPFEVLDNPNLLILPNPLASATFNTEYTAQLQAQGGLPPYTWILESGALPRGVALSPNGELSGTPEQVGTFRFVVEARDSGVAGRAARDQNAFVLQVVDSSAFAIATAELPAAIVDTGYDESIAAEGGQPPYDWSLESGRLPEGLIGEVDPNTGEYRIRGQPTELGVTNLLLTVTDFQGRTAQRAFALEVVEAPVVVETSDDSGCTCATGRTEGAASAGLLLLGLFGLAFIRRRS